VLYLLIVVVSLQVDHFSFTVKNTFRQRYLMLSSYWKGNGSPIFFYTGNEGDIGLFYNNTVSLSSHYLHVVHTLSVSASTVQHDTLVLSDKQDWTSLRNPSLFSNV